METLEQEYQSHIESMGKQRRQAQAETCALQEGREKYQSHMESMEEQLRQAQAQAETCALQESGENEAFSDRIKELTDELATQITLREAAESAMHEEGGTADADVAEIRELLEKVEELNG